MFVQNTEYGAYNTTIEDRLNCNELLSRECSWILFFLILAK